MSDFRPDIDFVAAAQTGFLDGAACLFAATVSAEAQGLLACSRHNLAPVDRDRAVNAFAGLLDRLEIDADFRNCVFDAS